MLSDFINQQLRIKNYESASTLCLFFQNKALKTKMTYEVMGLVQRAMQDKPESAQVEMHNFI